MCEKKPVDEEKYRDFLRIVTEKTAKIQGFIVLKWKKVVQNA